MWKALAVYRIANIFAEKQAFSHTLLNIINSYKADKSHHRKKWNLEVHG